MWNARLDEAQAGIKISGRNISNLRYTDDTTLMSESEELKSLLMKVKEESEKAGLKLNIKKTKIMASGPTTSWQKDGETMETVIDLVMDREAWCAAVHRVVKSWTWLDDWTLLGFLSETESIGFVYMWRKFYCKILAQATMEAGKSSVQLGDPGDPMVQIKSEGIPLENCLLLRSSLLLFSH